MDLRITFACVLWVALLVLAIFPAVASKDLVQKRWWWIWGGFALLLSVALPLWRWRSLVYNGEINVDESQILAQALRYQLDPIPWRSVDGGSGGPLYTWALFWAPLLGLKFNYLAARITGLVCYWLTCTGISLAASRLVGRRFALLVTLPILTLSLTALNFDYVFFSSEQLPMALMAWSCYLLTLQAPVPKTGPAFLLGLLTGALPFCKIQVGPAGVLLWLIGASMVWVARKQTPHIRSVALAQIAGGLTTAVLILGPVLFAGAWNEFVTVYLKGGLVYRNSSVSEGWSPVSHLLMLINAVPEFKSYYLALLLWGGGLAGLGFLHGKKGGPKALLGSLAIVLFLCISAYSVARSGYPFAHYTLLLLVPFALLALIPALFADVDALENARVPNYVLGSVLFLSLLPQIRQVWQDYQKQPALLGNWGSGIHPIGEVIQKLTKPGDTILVWGYAPKFHVFSGVPPSYRVITTLPLLTDPDQSPTSPTTLRYAADLAQHPPELFIDAPDEFWFPDPSVPKGAAARHFLHPFTSSLVSKNYTLVGQMNYPDGPPGTPKKLPIFIYKKKPSS